MEGSNLIERALRDINDLKTKLKSAVNERNEVWC